MSGTADVPPLDPFLARTHIAYFSMEMAVRPEAPSYAGGLGILADDTARSFGQRMMRRYATEAYLR